MEYFVIGCLTDPSHIQGRSVGLVCRSVALGFLSRAGDARVSAHRLGRTKSRGSRRGAPACGATTGVGPGI